MEEIKDNTSRQYSVQSIIRVSAPTHLIFMMRSLSPSLNLYKVGPFSIYNNELGPTQPPI